MRIPANVRFMRHVEMTEGCWNWTGALFSGQGYGMFRVNSNSNGGIRVVAHRFAYELFVGPIPDGQLICHSCDNRKCVRPDHLFAGTHSDNALDSYSKPRLSAAGRPYSRTHCPHGHEFTPENTITGKRSNGKAVRFCRACRETRGFRPRVRAVA